MMLLPNLLDSPSLKRYSFECDKNSFLKRKIPMNSQRKTLRVFLSFVAYPFFLVAFVFLAIFASGCSKGNSDGIASPTGQSNSAVTPSVEKGEQLFKAECQPCHGPDGKKSMPGMTKDAVDLSSKRIQNKSDPELKKIIREGRKGSSIMVGHPWLTSDEIDSLVLYLRALK
ncbi:MAG: hypothetical protein A3A28_03850 [Candidatus Sungbacteria bacterium RIFCSPLOWO2_01_FULL_47_32]|nr:MAG: hypothetical protein A3A28_03850 [Candidatus Sungbacteria bacterium RIFCSPLOWO2_01_FULL_47_32]